jgi:hypothetical protein
MHHTYISNFFDSLEKMKAIIGKYVKLIVNDFLTCQFSMLQSCSIPSMILIMHLNFNCKMIIIQ